jgi:hypothetical protein
MPFGKVPWNSKLTLLKSFLEQTKPENNINYMPHQFKRSYLPFLPPFAGPILNNVFRKKKYIIWSRHLFHVQGQTYDVTLTIQLIIDINNYIEQFTSVNLVLFMASNTGSPSSRYRPNTLVNLGDFVREEISSQRHGTPPVNVPGGPPSSSRPINSAPAAKKHVLFGSPVGYSSSLVEPVMGDSEILSTSATSVSSSLMQRHRDAASWSAHNSNAYGTMSHPGGGSVSPDMTKSVNFENECIKIQERNEAKRQEHSTTYVICMSAGMVIMQ